MSHKGSAPDLGAPDPEQKNSPIFDGSDSDELSLDREFEEGVCYFNNQSFGLGSFVCSGEELLRCENRGVWIREGACEHD